MELNVSVMELEDIIKGCYKGKNDAREALYKEFSQKMYAVCLRYCRDPQMAQDVLHDAFFKVFTKFKSYDSSQPLGAWIHRITVNTALDHLRKANRFKETDDSELNYKSNSDSTDSSAIMNDLNALLDLLPIKARTVFNLYAIEGYKHHEIAGILDISEGTSKSQYSRAKGLLQNLIKDKDRF